MNKVQKKRLLNVARALREARGEAKRAFHMGTFVYDRLIGQHTLMDDCSYEDLQAYFGISYNEFQEIFSSNGCGKAETTIQAARYIEKFVARKEKTS